MTCLAGKKEVRRGSAGVRVRLLGRRSEHRLEQLRVASEDGDRRHPAASRVAPLLRQPQEEARQRSCLLLEYIAPVYSLLLPFVKSVNTLQMSGRRVDRVEVYLLFKNKK